MTRRSAASIRKSVESALAKRKVLCRKHYRGWDFALSFGPCPAVDSTVQALGWFVTALADLPVDTEPDLSECKRAAIRVDIGAKSIVLITGTTRSVATRFTKLVFPGFDWRNSDEQRQQDN